MAISHSDSSLSRAGRWRCGTGSGKASAIIASAVAIALVLPTRRDERVIALPLCPTLARQLLTIGWREAGRCALVIRPPQHFGRVERIFGAGITGMEHNDGHADVGFRSIDRSRKS